MLGRLGELTEPASRVCFHPYGSQEVQETTSDFGSLTLNILREGYKQLKLSRKELLKEHFRSSGLKSLYSACLAAGNPSAKVSVLPRTS